MWSRMLDKWVLRVQCLILIILGIFATDSGSKDPFSQQPRLVVQDGNLILQSGFNRNVSLATRGQGSIVVNNADLGSLVSSAQSGGTLQSSSIIRLVNRVTDLTNKLQTLNDLTLRVSALEENITDIASKVDQFIGSGQDAISNRGLRRIMSKVRTLEDKVNSLTQLLTVNECSSNPCRNGGTCMDTYNGYICKCPSNWEGVTCETDVNECAIYAGTSFGCQNGATCINTHGGYSCQCASNWNGIHCTQKFDDCSTASHQELCGHGTCIDEKRVQPGQPKYRCICDPGWQSSSSSPACTEDIDECNGPQRRCSQNPLVLCINLPGTFHCGPCPAGYTGDGYSCADINECEVNNGGCSMQPFVQCTNTMGSRLCGPCPAGYAGNGVYCSFVGVCSINRGGCHPLASCIENTAMTGTYRECRCPPGYIGSGEGLQGCIQAAGMSCADNPCRHGTCELAGQSFRCVCFAGYYGTLCDQEEDPCLSHPCQNGGTCIRRPGNFTCICSEGYEGPTCANSKSTCGGFLTGNNGTLQFPENGVHYDHMMSCAWIISVDEDKVVNITFDHFDLEQGHNCEFDFLQLNDGPNAGSRVIGRFCAEDLHGANFSSTHNELYLWFQSDSTVAATGFSLNWTAIEPVCGGVLPVADYGSVNSPGYPASYPRNRNCSWTVKVPPGKRIQFVFATLQLEHHENCSYDYLKVYDGARSTDPEIGTFCSTVTPPPLITSGSTATLVFHSDYSNEGTGFHIAYTSVPGIHGCGGTLTAPQGVITSPNFPDVYENNLNCEWLIRIRPENRILLTFQEFNLERHSSCRFDRLEIYAGSNDAAPLLYRLCGSTVPDDIFTDSNVLFIRFYTDSFVSHSGFKAKYKTICGGVYTDLTGVLTSPYYPLRYPARASCIYDIRLPPGYIVNVTFHSMSIESHRDCKYDYLDVHDGDSEEAPLLSHICGYRIPESIISSYNFLWMKFETDGSIQNRGFYSVYEGMPMGCGGLLTEDRGQISSPRHPDRYPHSLTCRWLIRAPETHVIRLTFSSFYLEMDSQCRFDYVDVEESSGASLGRFCGSRTPPILTSLENTIIVKFVTDSSISRDGFNANYEFLDASQACGGTYYQESGVIRSPGFPNRYPHSAHCVWIIQAKDHRQITLNVTRFEMEDHDNCRFDYLEIRNGGTETSPLLGKYCGNRTIPEIRSHSNTLRLEFKSDMSMSAPGFEIFFDTTSVGCGGILSSPRGSIVSPNYPQAYPFNADCEWLIRISHGSVISVTIIEIDIEEHDKCMYDYLQILDGDSENSKCLLNICNNQQNPGAIVSTGNTMLLRFRSDSSQEAGGFHLVYQTLCNNVLTKRRGVIESPNFPDTYPHNHNCSWTISAPRGNNISIAFSHFFLETTASCDADYVEVLEVKNNEQVQLGKYCGGESSPPKTIETSTDTAIVRLITDSSVTREGFRLEYAMKGCGGDIDNKDFGFITSPNYPNGYPISTSCFWHISYPPGSRVELTILELDLEAASECIYDYLRVYGGEDENSPRLLNTCHRINGSEIVTSHGNQMVVHFSSDSYINGRGFKASFKKLDTGTSGCGGQFTAAESTILSPNFPDPYNVNDECEYLIQTSSGHRVELEFYDFEIPQGTNCSLGHVAIYDGRNSSSRLLGKYCGAKPEGFISSTSNQMLVKLVADGNNVGKGFRAHYRMVCGSRLLADEGGEILSPNYPHGSHELMNCSWIIYTSEPGEKVSLLVTHLEIAVSDNCSFASLTIKDGDMPDSPVSGLYCGYSSPPLIMSRGSILQVNLQNRGIFRATYGPASTHCGGAFKSPEGTFATPGYPLNYPLDTECIWTIEASAGSNVLISFTSFVLESSEYCNKDYVEIHKNDASGPMIGRYCGSEIPSNLTTAHKLWIKFRSDDIGTSNGFSAQYSIQHSNVLNGTEGEIASPGYPHKYSRSNVEWTVIVPTGMFVSVRFIDFGIVDLGESHSCRSTLRIYDGFDDSAPVLGEFCGYNIPEPLVSTSNVLFIRLEAYHYYDASFYLQWAAVTESGVVVTAPTVEGGTPCWQEITLNTSELLVTSPNYPENYPDNYNCTYVIRAPHYQHVELNITDLELEEWFPQCSFDRLEIYYALNPALDAWHLNASYCGRETPPLFVSPTNLMKLQFVTDGYTNYRGFNATAMPKCGARFTESNGVIKSEYIHTHLSDRLYKAFFCEYYIHVKPRRTIQLTFDQFSVASDSICSTNYLVIRNGGTSTSPPLGSGTYCGTSAPSLPETSTNEAYVKVVISSLAQGVPVFELRYTELSLGCGGHIYLNQETPNAEISSPNYPAPPTHDIECEWIITSPAGTRIRMDFENEFHMSPDCYDGDNVEYLQIYDGGTDMAPALQRYCGHDQPSSVQSTGNALYAVYVTAVDEPQAGFKATVRIAACGGTISSTYSAAIKSPNYPQPYGNSQECEWFLKMRNGYHIILRIMDLDTPANQNCSLTDYLEIRDYDSQGEVLGTFCGSLTNGSQVIDVPSPQAYIKFKTNSAVTGKGFHIVMNAKFNEGCGGYVEGISSGVITSPHYPNPLTGKRECFWHVEAPEGRRVKLTFNAFNLPRDEATGMCLSHLRTMNISYWRRGETNLTKLCGNSRPADIRSYTSTAVVVFMTHGLAAGQGFSLTYSFDEEANCGGPLLLPSGNISSPPFTAINNTYIDCRWKLQGDGLENRTVVIKLDVLDVPGLKSSYCRKGGVYVYGKSGESFYFGRYCENNTSPVIITSPLAATTVRLTGLIDKAFRGVHGTYNVSNCGGIIDVTTDVNITSPGYPNSYPPNTDCHWILRVPRGEEISLTTVDLRMENDCSKDYVKIVNGHRYDSPVLGTFCGDHSPHPVTSTNNYLVIKFHSDEFGTGPGFWMTSSEIQRGCGGVIGMPRGNISSPNYPSRYGNNEECVWIIEYLPGYIVRLEFVGRFDIETSSSCDKDYLLFEDYNENDELWEFRDRKCGSSTPEPIESKGRKMKITFRSNSQINADGFNIKFSIGCGGNFTQYHGQIFSPNYPVVYGDNLNCTYTIGKPGQYISITFDENFSIEQNTDCIFDYLEIYQIRVSDDNKQGKYCGSIPPATRTLLGPVTVRFVTDVSYGSNGFLLSYEIMSCGAIFTEPRGVIATPPSLNFLNYMDCTWQIVAQPNKVIALKFSSFDLKSSYNCWREYLEVRDGNLTGPLIGRLCTSDKVLYKSTGNQLSLRYHSEYKETEKGFSAFYYNTYGSSQGCGGMLNTSTGEIKSVDVDSDGQYESNLDCNWLIMTSSPNQVILLNFTSFEVESSRNNTCVYDYVELRDGMSKDSPLIGHYCGSTPPSPIITSGNIATVIFHTNDGVNLAGFTIKYSLIPSPCGTTALTSLSSAQNLTSPNYPGPYPVNLRCTWTISKNTSAASPYYRGSVQVSINEMDIPCNGDYVEIQRKYRYQDVSTLRLCGSKHPHEIVIESGYSVTFHSDGVNNGARGFSFSYKNGNCNRTFMKDNGVLSNSDYPYQYNTESYCAMTINATAGKTISLYFRDISIHLSENCAEEYLKIYDGQNTSARLISTLCGYETPPPAFSTGNFLHLVFSIKYSFGAYYATYTTTDQGRGCGGRLYAEKGALSSPLFPQPYNRTADCIWYISVPGYHTARIQFTSFALNSTDGCDTNYVEIYDGHTVDIAKRIVRYCGTDTPAEHNSQNNEIIVRFVSSPSNDRPGFTMIFESNGYFPEKSMSVFQLHNVEAEDSYSSDYMYL